MSVLLTVNTEPKSTASKMWVFTLAETNSNKEAPTARETERKTPIKVSDDSWVRPLV